MSEFLDEELVGGAHTRMERHLGGCHECERLLAGLRAVVQGLGRLPAPTPAGGAAGADAARIAALVRGRLDEPPAS